MKIIFIAGPYRAETPFLLKQNIIVAECVAVEVWKLGCGALCPHMNSAFLDGLVPDKQFLTAGLEMARRCDAVLMISGWKYSVGARDERMYAHEHGVPVFESIGELSAWLVELAPAEPACVPDGA